MKAAVLEGFEQPLHVRDVERPEPGPGEAVVRVRAAGICRTDLKIVGGLVPTVETPRILGHEPAGEVAGVGPGVEAFREGDRVAVAVDISCGSCAYCRVGELDHCAALRRVGFEHDGGLAEYLRVPAVNLVPVSDSMPFEIAATIPDAVGSSYHAVVVRAGVRPAQTVAVYGLGGLGLVAVQVASLIGARVIAIARTPQRRRLAEELGATWTVDPDSEDLVETVRRLTGGLGVHAFLDIVGIKGSVEAGARSCRKGGKVVVLGYDVPQLQTAMMGLVVDEISILGSRGSTRADLHEAAQLMDRGLIRPVVGREIALEEVNDGLDLLRDGSVIGRVVVRLP